MITKATDAQVRSFILSHMARHRFDAERVRLEVLNGTVTLGGQLWHSDGRPTTANAILRLEGDVRATTGVVSVFFELVNWERGEDGVWHPARPSKKRRVARYVSGLVDC